MAIVFPASPSVSDTFTEGSITYKWDGAKWIGLGVTPAQLDRLVEGSNSLEINASNNLVWTGNNVGIQNTSPDEALEVGAGTVDGGLKVSGQSSSVTSDGFTVDWESSSNSTRIFSEPSSGGSSAIRFFTTNSGSRAEALRITSAGDLFVAGTGGSGDTTQLPNGSTININGNSSNDGFSIIRYSGGYGAYGLNIGRSKSGTVGTNAIVSNNNDIGHITFYGADGSSYLKASMITAQVDGTPSAGSGMPGRLVFKTSPDGSATPVERLRISSDGNVSITNNPTTNASKLFIRANSGANAGKWSDSCIALYNTTGASEYSQIGLGYTLGTWAPSYMGYINTSTSSFGMGALVFGTRNVVTDSQPTERLRIASDGKIAIGGNYDDTSAFGRQVLISGTVGLNNDSGNVGVGFSRGTSNTYGYIGTGAWAINGLDNDDFGISCGSTGDLVLGTGAGTERLRINANGRVDIGDELGVTHAGQFQVIHTGGGQQDNDALSFFETNAQDWIIMTNYNASGTHYHMRFMQQGGVKGAIYGSSGADVQYAGSSDYRLKENIVEITGTQGIDICKKLKPSYFNWIENRIQTGETNTVDGFIAHEVQEAGLLGVVTGEKDAVNEDGSINGQMMDYGKMTPVLAAAIKGLISKVEDLEQRLSAASL